MANRSYLYASNVVPGPDVKAQAHTVAGISEWNYDIPIVYKLLLSGNPRPCRSFIWNTPHDIALVGGYAPGVERLTAFLNRIDLPAARPLIEETLGFLADAGNIKQYFILECGEIFEMGDDPMQVQNARLLEEIKNLDAAVEQVLGSLRPAKPSPWSVIARLFGAKPPPTAEDPLQVVRDLGLGNWSNVLYHELD
ncbi:DUF7822 domain-containing protein [Verminephrobacter eiseniae]|uniref:DUF7822 domain-containing protein n=1 Tax=Verminephrobacter eiseniae TaxID=364317 RepID=UPI00223724A3|nr:hypothetical protein [Verminephrobacter eiseniae]MCW5233079.1 hypothetical protein [Verminephrobacter eiseniae]MCW5295365.1 hypothetical protein [Verminephrobacter eiseniae]MCW8187545.1 hypothetical protein [Verminephrobacter eiseniae]MCW8222930.1 hypothetical protein [Verminephrobacter eiseniae]MCW8233420.1 hypothetical protein [Verminephrobacter eiseniae]